MTGTSEPCNNRLTLIGGESVATCELSKGHTGEHQAAQPGGLPVSWMLATDSPVVTRDEVQSILAGLADGQNGHTPCPFCVDAMARARALILALYDAGLIGQDR